MNTSILQNTEGANSNILIIKKRIRNLICRYVFNNHIVTEELVERIRRDRTLKNISNIEISSKINEAKEEDKLIYLKLGIQIDPNYYINYIIDYCKNNNNLIIISLLIKNYIFNNNEESKDVLCEIVSLYNDKLFIENIKKYLKNLISSDITKEPFRQKYVSLASYILPKYFLNEIMQDYLNNEDEKLLSDRLNIFDWNQENNLNDLLVFINTSKNIPLIILDILKKSSKKKEAEKIICHNKGKQSREYYYLIYGVLFKDKSKNSSSNKKPNLISNSNELIKSSNSVFEIDYEALVYDELPLVEFEQTFNINVFENNNVDENIDKFTKDKNISSNDYTYEGNSKEITLSVLKKTLGKIIGKLLGKYLQEKDDYIKEELITKIKSYDNFIIITRPAILNHLQNFQNNKYKRIKYLELGLKIDKDFFENWMKKEKKKLCDFIDKIKLNEDETIYNLAQKYNFNYEETLKIISDKIKSLPQFSLLWGNYLKFGLFFNPVYFQKDLIIDYINNIDKSILVFFVLNYDIYGKDNIENFFGNLINYQLYNDYSELDKTILEKFYDCIFINENKSNNDINPNPNNSILSIINNIVRKKISLFKKQKSNKICQKLIKYGLLLMPKLYIKDFIEDYNKTNNSSILSTIIKNFRYNNNFDTKVIFNFYNSCDDEKFSKVIHKLIHKNIYLNEWNINKKIQYIELGLRLEPQKYISNLINIYDKTDINNYLNILNKISWNSECSDKVLKFLNKSKHVPNVILDKIITNEKKDEIKSILEQNREVLKDEYLYFLSKTSNYSNITCESLESNIDTEQNELTNHRDNIIKPVDEYYNALKDKDNNINTDEIRIDSQKLTVSYANNENKNEPLINNDDLTETINNENINKDDFNKVNNEISDVDTDDESINGDTNDVKESLEISVCIEPANEEASNNNNLLETNTGNEKSDEPEKENKKVEESDLINERTNDISCDSNDLKEKAIDNKDTSEVIANDTLTTDQTNYINKTNNGDGLLKSTGIDGNKSEEAETQTEFENNKSVSVEQIIDLIDLENTLEKAGVCKSETKPFAAYLLSAYMHKIPVLLAGSSGVQIATVFSASVFGSEPYIFDCKCKYDTSMIDNMLKSKNEVVIIKHFLATKWRETLTKLFSENKKFYILTTPFYEDLSKIVGLYINIIPFITELIIDKPPINKTLEFLKIDLPKPISNTLPLHNELLNDMMLAPYSVNQIQTLLNEMRHISGIDSNIIDFKYVFFPYAYATKQGECTAKEWIKVDKNAEKYLSKYFNIKNFK